MGSRRYIFVQQIAISVAMVRMHSVDNLATAARRTSDGVHALSQTSSEASMDGFGTTAGGAKKHAPAVVREDASEEADGGAVGVGPATVQRVAR